MNENQNIKCVSCKKSKSTTDFTINIKTNLLYKQCQQCKEYKKVYKKENKEKIKEYYTEYNNKNKEKKKEYYDKNKDKLNEYQKEYNNDINNRIRNRVNCRIREVIKNKLPDYKIYLGCDINEYIIYIESKFNNDMNWNNYGRLWNIDHTRPLNPKVKISQEEVIKRLHYSNTRPLYCIENMIKRNKEIIEETFEEELFKNFENKEEEEQEYAEIIFIDEDEVLQVIIDTYL
jgi:hypothetical protein